MEAVRVVIVLQEEDVVLFKSMTRMSLLREEVQYMSRPLRMIMVQFKQYLTREMISKQLLVITLVLITMVEAVQSRVVVVDTHPNTL